MKVLISLVLLLFAYVAASGQADTAASQNPPQHITGLAVIRHIIIEGNVVTRRSAILRELSVHEGTVTASDSLPILLRQNTQRLVNTSLFNDIDIRTEWVAANEMDWRISVKERWYILPKLTIQYADRNFNTWYVEQHHDLSRLNLGITISDVNFSGTRDTLSGTVQVGYTQGIGLAYQLPYIDKQQKNGIGFFFNYFRSRQTYYASDSDKLLYITTFNGYVLRQFQAGCTYIYRPAYSSRHIVQLSYQQYSVQDTLLHFNPEYYANGSNTARFFELIYRYELNMVDNWNYPLYGLKIINYVTFYAGLQGLNFQAADNFHIEKLVPLMPKWYFAAIFRSRLMIPARQPYYFQGGLGTSTDYVRGYEYYVIDGEQYGVLRLDLKRALLEKMYRDIPIKYLTSFPLRIYPKIFIDAGYISNSDPVGHNYLSNTLLCSVGAGIDIVTLYDIKIRIEAAYNRMGRNGLYLHFNGE